MIPPSNNPRPPPLKGGGLCIPIRTHAYPNWDRGTVPFCPTLRSAGPKVGQNGTVPLSHNGTVTLSRFEVDWTLSGTKWDRPPVPQFIVRLDFGNMHHQNPQIEWKITETSGVKVISYTESI